jgi:hypothetical protein
MADKDCTGYTQHEQFENDFREALQRLDTDPAYYRAFQADPTNVTRDYCLTQGMYGALLTTHEQFEIGRLAALGRAHGMRVFRLHK